MVGQSFDTIKGHNPKNIRKILEMAIFIKRYEDDDEEVSSIWDGTGLVLPSGYEPVGLTTKADGATWQRDQEVSDVTSHGYAEPTRRDILSDQTGLQFTAQEAKRTTLELDKGVDLSSVKPDANGNLVIDKPSRPQPIHWRVLAIGKDGDGPDAIYVVRWLPRAQVTENAEQKWSEEDELQFPATMSAYNDMAVGTSMREIWGGPGLDHAAMGFPATA